ncbi:branched-chain amino acid ABC transporter permease [Halorientalis halophila]|uniref:branched-chain amino acid ABC transporter permease n=1 Tax=Halorientalis halophila TaxID=3108499 RepID=UPI0030085A11
MSNRHRAGLVGLVLLAGLPAVLEPTMALTFAGAYFFGVYAMSWDVVSGYTGQISFGHGLFFGVGGYTSALLNAGYGLDPVLSIPVGVLLAAVAGIIIGVPALRLRGPYLSLVTLVAPLILVQLFIYRSDIFNGEQGISPAKVDALLGLSTFGDEYMFYYIALALFVFVLALLWTITRSDAGAVFTAIREDEDTVSASGLNPAKFKIMAFVLSAAVGGLAGAMIVHTPSGNASPSTLLAITVNVEVIIAAILGGMGTIVGAAIGGVLLILLQNQLLNVDLVVPLLDTPISEMDFLVFAIITLILLFAFPGGLIRWAFGLTGMFKERVFGGEGGGPEVATDGGAESEANTPLEQVYENYTDDLRAMFGGDDDER